MTALPHLALIRYPPRERDDPICIMWWFPDDSHFLWEDSVLVGLGRLQPAYIARLRGPCTTLVERARHDSYKEYAIAQEYAALIPRFLDRLTFLLAPFRTTQLLVREIQRMYLELQACLNWQDIYQPRMNARVTVDSKVARVIGTFTMNLGICEDLYRSGIPIFLIRPSDQINTMRIRSVVTPVHPEGFIPVEEAIRPTYRSIYRGPATDEKKYLAIRRFARRLQVYANPFNEHRVEPRAEPLPTSSALTDRKARTERYSPYAQRKKLQSDLYEPQGQNKFEDLPDPILPPAIPAWRDALRQVNQSKSNFVDPDTLGSDFGYAFPEPASFIAYEKKERRSSTLRCWLRYRDALIYRFSFEGSQARPMSGKAWRDLLGLDWFENAPSTSQSKKDDNQKTKSSSRRELLTDFLQTCLQAEGVSLDEMVRGKEAWQGKDFENLQDADFEEILWEMGELNFRQELLALDIRITNSDSSIDAIHRQELIAACFPGGQLLMAPLSEANHGLASYDGEERCRHLLALRRLMRDWPGKKPDILNVDQLRWRPRDTEDLEIAVATFYTQTFFNYFRRAPIIPRRLSHNVPGFVPPPPILEHLNPAPNTYYDMTYLLALDPTL
ncbi:hypothetical protein Hypma_007053 [Hypsizygus marmoreus]|uniref:Uncharacterized protein n=1 Tax=Hypsizygus marmoreus TaxID=39966 RepID=A0A369KBU2_HYPMA|nr:hypothetical protein Hypma_007053 [Hypsizygus marmoreus]